MYEDPFWLLHSRPQMRNVQAIRLLQVPFKGKQIGIALINTKRSFRTVFADEDPLGALQQHSRLRSEPDQQWRQI